MSLVPGPDAPRPSGPGVKLTFEDFVLFPDDGKRHELIDGEHHVTPAPNPRHQLIVVNLVSAIRGYLRTHRIGRVFVAPLDVVFSPFDVVEPDLLLVSKERRDVVGLQNVQGSPDLVVEVGSPSTRRRDERTKHQLYERYGVSEYWIVDTDLDLIKVYRLVDGRYSKSAELTLADGDVLTTPLLPGLQLRLVEIFEED